MATTILDSSSILMRLEGTEYYDQFKDHLRSSAVQLVHKPKVDYEYMHQYNKPLSDEECAKIVLQVHRWGVSNSTIMHFMACQEDGSITDQDLGFLTRLVAVSPDRLPSISHYLMKGVQFRYLKTLTFLGFHIDYLGEIFMTRSATGEPCTVDQFLVLLEELDIQPTLKGHHNTYDWVFTHERSVYKKGCIRWESGVPFTEEEIMKLHSALSDRGFYLTEVVMHNSMGLHGFKYFPLFQSLGPRVGHRNYPQIVESVIVKGTPQQDYDAPPLPIDLEARKQELVTLRKIPGFEGVRTKIHEMPKTAYAMGVEYLDWLVTEGWQPNKDTFEEVCGLSSYSYNEQIPVDARQRILLWLDKHYGDAIVLPNDDYARHLEAYNYGDRVYNDETREHSSEMMQWCMEHLKMVRSSKIARDQRHTAVRDRKSEFRTKYGISEYSYKEIQLHLGRHNGVCEHYAKGQCCPEWPMCKKYHGPIQDTYRVKECKKEDCPRDETCTDFHYPTTEQKREYDELQQYYTAEKYGGKDPAKLSWRERYDVAQRMEENPYCNLYLYMGKDWAGRPGQSAKVSSGICHAKIETDDDGFTRCRRGCGHMLFMVRSTHSQSGKTKYYCSHAHMVKTEGHEPPYVLKEPYHERPSFWRSTSHTTPEDILRRYFGEGRDVQEYDYYDEYGYDY